MSVSNKHQSQLPIAASLAQELLSPLQALLGHADMLEATELSAEQRGLLDMIRRSGQSLQVLISDLVDVSQVKTGPIAVTQREFDVHETIEDAVANLIPAAYARGLELVLMVYRDVPARLYGDPVRLHQILIQLLGASIQRSPQGSVVLRVMLESETPERALLRFGVSDAGVGIGIDTQKTKRISNEDAAVGLQLSRQLIDLLSGQLDAEGAKVSGFGFVLPFSKPPKAGSSLPWLGLNGRKIRLIDNNPLARTALAHHFELWDVQIVQQGTLANLSVGGTPLACDVAVLGLAPQEIQQPELITFLGQCKARDIPVLSLVASLDEDIHRRLRELGATASLPKSVNRLTLYRVLCRLAGAAAQALEQRLDLHELPVLVADDVLANRRLLKILLEQLGARPTLVEGGEAAVSEWQRGRYKLVLTDIRMPDLDGAGVTRAIRRLENPAKRCVIVGITAALDAPLRRQLLDAGMNDCMLKPTDRHALLRDLKPWVIQPLELPSPSLPPSPSPSPVPPASSQLAESQTVLKQNPELLQLLAEALPLQLGGLEQAVARDDTDSIRDELHQLHGTAAFYRLNQVRDCVTLLEKSLKQDKLLLAESLLPLKHAVAILLEEIRVAPPVRKT
ncbi:MAG: response regulator [Nevskiales bacterium]